MHDTPAGKSLDDRVWSKDDRALDKAVRSKDDRALERLLAKDAATGDGRTFALWSAITVRRPSAVELLLRHDADPNGWLDDEPVLHCAAEELPYRPTTAPMVRALVEHGASLSARDVEGTTPLLAAARKAALLRRFAELADRLSVIDTLLDLGASLDERDRNGNSAAVLALLEGDEALAETLVERGAGSDGLGAARLLLAAARGRVDEVAALLAAGAEPNRQFDRRGTALSEATSGGYREVVQRLLEAGADPNLREAGEPEDNLPLFSAANAGHLEILEDLLDAGADPHARVDGRGLLDVIPRDAGEVLETVRQATAGRRTVRLTAVNGELPAPAAAVAALPGLADLSWRATAIGDFQVIEGYGQAALSERWLEVQQAAATHGFSAVLAGWSLEDPEPEQRRVEQAIAAVSAEQGRGDGHPPWIAKQIAWWRRAGERELRELEADGKSADDESLSKFLATIERGPLKAGSSTVRLPRAPHTLVLVNGPPELVPVIYAFEREDLSTENVGSALAHWRQRFGARVAAFDRRTLDLIVDPPLGDEQAARQVALELLAVAPGLYELCPGVRAAQAVTAMARSRQWSLAWE